MIIAVDFDGTIVRHRYPKIGEELPFATETLRMLIREGHRLILWTVREGKLLDEAIEWCRDRGVEFYAINRDFPEEDATGSGFSRKLKADLFIDDRNFGGLPDWAFLAIIAVAVLSLLVIGALVVARPRRSRPHRRTCRA